MFVEYGLVRRLVKDDLLRLTRPLSWSARFLELTKS